MKITIDFWGEDNDAFSEMSEEERAESILCMASHLVGDALEDHRIGNRAKLPLRDTNGNSVAYVLVEYEDR